MLGVRFAVDSVALRTLYKIYMIAKRIGRRPIVHHFDVMSVGGGNFCGSREGQAALFAPSCRVAGVPAP